jgi:MFS family permease
VCALLLVSGRSQLWLIYLVLFGYGAAGGLIGSAQTALLAVMLPEDLLGEANSLLQVADVGLRVITPLIGAGLLALVGAKPVILLDAGTFLGAGLALLALRLREPRPDRTAESRRTEFTAGLRHIGRTTALRRLLISCTGALLVFGFFRIIPFAVVGQGLHRSPVFLGVLESVMGGGALVGGLLAANLMRRTSERALVVVALTAAALGSLLLISGWLPVVLLAMALLGVCIV